MTGLVVLARGKATVSLYVADDGCVPNHVAQLATFLGRDIEIDIFDPRGVKWSGRGTCNPAEPR